MSKKNAQLIVDELYENYGISLCSHNLNQVLLLQEKLEEFLDYGIEPEDLKDPSLHSEDDFAIEEEELDFDNDYIPSEEDFV